MHYPPEPFRIKVTEPIRLISPEEREAVAKRFGGVCVSALNGEGIPEMLAAAERLTFEGEKR